MLGVVESGVVALPVENEMVVADGDVVRCDDGLDEQPEGLSSVV